MNRQIAGFIIGIRCRDYNLKWSVRGFSKRPQGPIRRSLFVLRTKHPWYRGDCIDQGSGEQKPSSLCSSEEFHVVARRKKAKKEECKAEEQRKKRSRRRPFIHLRPFLLWLTKEYTWSDLQSVFVVTLVNLRQKMVRQMGPKSGSLSLLAVASRQCNYNARIVWIWILPILARCTSYFISIIRWYIVIALIVITCVHHIVLFNGQQSVIIRLAGGIRSLQM